MCLKDKGMGLFGGVGVLDQSSVLYDRYTEALSIIVIYCWLWLHSEGLG